MEPSMIKTYVAPKYPYEARRGRAEGRGIVVIDVNSSTGTVTGVSMAKSTGNRMLDRAAQDGFLQWRFKPGTPRQIKVPIEFVLASGRVQTGYHVRSKSMDEVLSRFLGKGTVLKGPIPEYPEFPTWTNRSGKGVYELHADKDGKVQNVRIIKSSGDATFDRVAVKTLGKWRLRRGPLVLELPLSFTLTPTNYSVDVAR
ncbi:MAG: TonB family protein [Chthoniobacterales bacterium]